VYEKSFAILDDVKPSPSNQNKATLHYNCARAAANLGRHVSALQYCDRALELMPKYNSAVEQRAKCNVALFNFKLGVDDLDTLIAGATAADPGNLEQWMRLKKDAKAKLDESHFSVLGLVASGAGVSASDVKKAYRQQCIAWHPDKHVQSDEKKHRATIMFQRVNEANETLSDPLKKQQYEYQLRFARPAAAASPARPSYGGFSGSSGGSGYGGRSSPGENFLRCFSSVSISHLRFFVCVTCVTFSQETDGTTENIQALRIVTTTTTTMTTKMGICKQQ
jgi:hypothetical protein